MHCETGEAIRKPIGSESLFTTVVVETNRIWLVIVLFTILIGSAEKYGFMLSWWNTTTECDSDKPRRTTVPTVTSQSTRKHSGIIYPVYPSACLQTLAIGLSLLSTRAKYYRRWRQRISIDLCYWPVWPPVKLSSESDALREYGLQL